MVVADFELTVDDLKHATAAHVEANRRGLGRSRWRYTAAWVFAVLIMTTFSELMSRHLNWRYAGVVLCAGGMIACTLALVTMVLGLRQRDPNRQPVEQFVTLPPAWVNRLDWVLSLGVPLALFAAVVLLHQMRPTPPAPGRAPRWAQEFLVFWPWLPVLACCAWMIYRTIRSIGAFERLWKQNPTFQLRHRLEAGDLGLLIDNSRTRVETRWFAWKRFVETPQQFLLYSPDGNFHFIPKRGFAAEAQVDEFRDLLRRHVQGSAQGFPVQPVGAA
jgi:hypothetical protein